MAASGFSYQELDRIARHIRLLILHPNMNKDAPILCSLQTVSLFADLDFEAVSYAWGDATIIEPIVLENQTVPVAISIWSALKAFRHDTESRTLWIDAVCINQSNLVEKESQVQLMGSIYRKARIVRVWLGVPAESDRDAISEIKTLAKNESATDILKHGRKAEAKLKSLQFFFSRPWWQRLWVIQEVGCGRSVTFQIDEEIIDYDELYRAYQIVLSEFRSALRGFQNQCYNHDVDDFMSTFESVELLERIRRLCHTEVLYSSDTSHVRQMSMTWMAVANLLRDRKSTIPSDKLYALYGLLPIVTAAGSGMEPSYSMQTATIFTEVTYSLMKSAKTLMMFNYLAHRDDDSKELASWIPDWRLASRDNYEVMRRVEREQIFSAAQDTEFYIRRLSGSSICLKGFFIDVIKSCQDPFLDPSASPILDAAYEVWRETWADTDPENAMLTPYLDGSTGEMAFRRTMLWDCENSNVGSNKDNGSLQRLTPEESNAVWKAHDSAVKIALGEDHELLGQVLSDRDAQRTTYMINCVRDRRFFVTVSGLIGLAQKNLLPGDHIFVVAGNSHPVILRPSSTHADTWHAVSECYLHGFMYGAGIANIKVCKRMEDNICSVRAIKALKGTERNPVLDEIKEECEPYWKWLIVE